MLRGGDSIINFKKIKMKTTTLLLLLWGVMLAPTASFAQTKTINTFYKEFKGLDKNVKMTIPGWLIGMGAEVAKWSVDTPEEKESLNLLKKVNKLKLLVTSENSDVKNAKISGLFSQLRDDSFEDLIMVKEEDTMVNVMIRGGNDDDKIKNLFVLVREPEEIVMLSMKTNIKMEEVNELLHLMEDDYDLDMKLD